MFKFLEFVFAINIFIFCECKDRITLYPSIGDTIRLQCQSGFGQYICFSTYTFQNISHPMVMINASSKYLLQSGAVTINNVEATDAGYYGCSSNCIQMSSDLIDYYVHPISNQIPIDVTSSFLAIPPFFDYASGIPLAFQDSFNMPIEPPIYRENGRKLNAGEIAGIVIGCVSFVVIVLAIIIFIVVCLRRRNSNPNNQKPKKVKTKKGEKIQESSSERDYALKNETIKSDKNLIDINKHTDNSPSASRHNLNDLPNVLPNVEVSGRTAQPRLDNQARRNYEIADRIANQFAYENQQQQQQQAPPSLLQPKQITTRYDSYTNSFTTGLDAPPQQQIKPGNFYATNGLPLKPNVPQSGPISSTGYKYQQVSEDRTNEIPAKLINNRGDNEPQRPERNRIEFPTKPQLPQVLPQMIRTVQGGPTHRQYVDDADALEQTPPLLENYDASDDERRQLARDDSSEQSQQQNLPFKSLVRAKKQSKGDLIEALNPQQLTPSSRSYQGTAQLQSQQPLQMKFQLPQQLPPSKQHHIIDKRSDSTHAESLNAPVKDSATDV